MYIYVFTLCSMSIFFISAYCSCLKKYMNIYFKNYLKILKFIKCHFVQIPKWLNVYEFLVTVGT